MTDKGLLISNFTINHFGTFLEEDKNEPQLKIKIAQYGQVIPTLTNNKLIEKYDFIICWTLAEKLINSFEKLINYKKISISKILKEVTEYANLLINAAKYSQIVIVPTWVIPDYNHGLGMLDWKKNMGIRYILSKMNLHLSKILYKVNNIYILDSNNWIKNSEKDFNPKLWYIGKIPFDDEVFLNSISDIKACLKGINGEAKKLILLDLDDTLWGGIVGDLGWQKINLGGHNFIGEAFQDFQKALKALTNRGILLGIISKNEESIALQAIKKNPEMILKIDDFAGWKINWQDKAKNILELTKELNLGLQSVVFFDDNPVERARIKETLPEVTVPDLPKDKMLYKKTLLNLNLFDAPSISVEDRKRKKMYTSERKRKDLQISAGSLENWLGSLKIKVKIEELNKGNLPRTAQLLNKTNQMNLSTRRLAEEDLWNWTQKANNYLLTYRVTDKFGDSGLTGILSFSKKEQNAQIIDFILSCRVMGRKIEETMLFTLFKKAKKLKLKNIEAKYIKTLKNKPCLDFFINSGMKYNKKSNIFTWNLEKEYDLPSWIKLIQG